MVCGEMFSSWGAAKRRFGKCFRRKRGQGKEKEGKTPGIGQLKEAYAAGDVAGLTGRSYSPLGGGDFDYTTEGLEQRGWQIEKQGTGWDRGGG